MLPFLLPLLASAGGAAANAVAGGIGAAASAGDRERQKQLIEALLRDYDNLDVPELEQVAPSLLGPSAMEGVSTDPRLRGEELAVLERLGRLSETGDDAITKAALNKILTETGRQEAAGRNAVLDNMRARGVSGSGAELAAQLHNQQTSADRAQSAGLEAGAAAQKRMLDALANRGQLAGQIRRSDFGENSAKAAARDAISRYNAGATDRSKYYNAGLPAQQYQMNLQKLAGKSGVATGAARQAGESADRTAGAWAGVGSAANEAGAGLSRHIYDQNRQPVADNDEDETIPYYLRRQS
jgi:hypothetical protein